MNSDPKYLLDRTRSYGAKSLRALDADKNEDRRKHPHIYHKGRRVTHPSIKETLESNEADARVFVIERRQMMEFEWAEWDDFNPAFCCPPYRTFIIRPAHPIPMVYENETTRLKEGHNKIEMYLEEVFVHTSEDRTKLFISEFSRFDHKNGEVTYSATGVIADLETGTCLPVKYDDEWIGGKRPPGYSIRKKFITDDALALYTECQVTTRNVIAFLHLINNRKVTVEATQDEHRPINRQQRRAQGYVDRPHYKVTIPPRRKANSLVSEAMEGKELRYRRPHEVRAHPRRIKGRDEPTWVREHHRCGDPRDYRPEYDTGRIRQDDLEPIV